MAQDGDRLTAEVLRCGNCDTELNEFMFLVDEPETCESEVLCDHCGELSGVSIAQAYEVSN